MEKPAANQYPIHDLLRRRWSPWAFADRPVARGELRAIFEAARWAASCFNEQPWRFLVATREEPEEHARLASCLVEGNRAWAERAPVLILSVAKLRFERNDKENRHAVHDVGLAVANLVLQALDLGLWCHQMAGFHRDQAREVFAIPEGYEPVAMIALGYPGSPDDLPDKLRERQERPRSRQALAELVFTGRWGATAPWLGNGG